nr:MAG: hypothetical protein [Bacteriophage sp.]
MWELNLICKISPVNLDDKVIDLTENSSTKEHIFISNTISACVSGNSIDVGSFNNVVIDENIASLYDSILALKNRVEENDKLHEQNEAIRKANELERQEAETTRKANESERVSAEQLRVEAENTRKADETKRQSNESARVEAETNRDTAESERVNAENQRAEAETARQSAETNRASAENKRASAETFKQSLQGVYLYYELAAPIVTDISDIIGDTFQEPFNVESGGSLTFKNTNGDGYQLAVPSNVQYTIKLNEVTSCWIYKIK